MGVISAPPTSPGTEVTVRRSGLGVQLGHVLIMLLFIQQIFIKLQLYILETELGVGKQEAYAPVIVSKIFNL